MDELYFQRLIKNKEFEELAKQLFALEPFEVAQFINDQEEEIQTDLFLLLLKEKMPPVFEFLDDEVQKRVFADLPQKTKTYVLTEISPDDRTAFLENLPQENVAILLKLLPFEEREVALKLLGYPENSVGRLMTTDYLTLKPGWNLNQVLSHLRSEGVESETIDVLYVIDDEGQLIDDIRIRELILAPSETKVSDLLDRKFIALRVDQDAHEVVDEFLNNDRVALPVVDPIGTLLGIVTIDDMLQFVQEEDTEDFQRFGGTEALDTSYLKSSFFELMRKRVSWLVLLFLGEMLTATAMRFYEYELSQAIVLAFFIPLIISSGGNAGSQASTLIIRALAIGEITLKDFWLVLKRELLSGVFLGGILGSIGFLRVGLWGSLSDAYGPHWVLLAWTLFFSLIGVVLWGTVMGAIFPMLLRRLGFDPAVSSAPFVATLVDVTGLIIYFFIASILLQGTLL